MINENYDYIANPKGAWMTVNRSCNFRCPWCYAKDTLYNKNCEMSFKMAKELSKILKKMGISNVMLIGGEPTMWEHLYNFNRLANEIDLTTTIITNAYLFSDDDYWEKYRHMPADYSVISIKGVSEEQLIKNAGIANIKNAKIGMERAAQIHKVVGAETVCSTLTTKEDLIDIAIYAKHIGAQTFLVSLCNITLEGETAVDHFVIDSEESMRALLDAYSKLDDIFGENLEIHTTLPYCILPADFLNTLMKKKQLSSACNVHSRSGIVFDYNGDVLFCNSIFNTVVAKYKKDFHDSASLIEYLNRDSVKEEYAEILRFPAECCTYCSQNAYCRGGCIANWIILDPKICNPL